MAYQCFSVESWSRWNLTTLRLWLQLCPISFEHISFNINATCVCKLVSKSKQVRKGRWRMQYEWNSIVKCTLHNTRGNAMLWFIRPRLSVVALNVCIYQQSAYMCWYHSRCALAPCYTTYIYSWILFMVICVCGLLNARHAYRKSLCDRFHFINVRLNFVFSALIHCYQAAAGFFLIHCYHFRIILLLVFFSVIVIFCHWSFVIHIYSTSREEFYIPLEMFLFHLCIFLWILEYDVITYSNVDDAIDFGFTWSVRDMDKLDKARKTEG